MPTEDGGLDLFDLLYDRIVHLSAEEARQLEVGDPNLLERLKGQVLFEGDHAETLRHELWSRRRAELAPRAAPPIAQVDWSEAAGWPALVAAPWRDPERLRRLAEHRAAGATFLDLPGFVAPDTARRLAERAGTLPFERMDTEWARGERRLLAPGDLDEWITFLASGRTRRLLGGVLGRELPETLTANAWRLGTGDGMPVHADGRHYHGTVSLGLCEGWTARRGGAIATGVPTSRPAGGKRAAPAEIPGDGRFEVRQRWLPHLGDLLLFAPARTTWHAVEPVERGPRLSLTAWWTEGAVGAALSPTGGRGDGA